MRLTQKVIDQIQLAMTHTKMNEIINMMLNRTIIYSFL